jgi:transketolase
MNNRAFDDPAKLAHEARHRILNMTHEAQAPHVGSCLSVVDILSVLYSRVSNITPKNVGSICRDIVILSKGHSAAALYSVLSLQEFFDESWLSEYCKNGASLGGHVTHKGVPGVELSTGSLGHGIPYGLGIALSRKRYGVPGRVFVVISDGECDEGTTWESALIANHFNLDNLCVIIDRNRLQSLTFTEETLKLEPIVDKWKAFGWEVESLSGHDYPKLEESLKHQSGPKCVIAETIKGKGVGFMENSVLWHYKPPSSEDLSKAYLELGAKSS